MTVTPQNIDELEPSYIHLSRAWYGPYSIAEDLADEVTVSFMDREGEGTAGEFAIRWYHLRDGDAPAAKLEVFHDGFSALGYCQDLLEWLYSRDDRNPRPEEVCEALAAMDYVDRTPERSPFEE